MDSPKRREGLTVLASPENRCPVSTLDSNVALPMYRTFMAHKYQELSMISLLYYQETLTADGGTPMEAIKTVIWHNSISPVSHTYRDTGSSSGTTAGCDAGLSPIRPRKRHSIRRSAQALYIARAQIQSTVRFILP